MRVIIIHAMGDSSSITVRRVEWREAAAQLRAIRFEVFVTEQHVPEELEWDGRDEQCVHVLARTQAGQAVGTARLLPDAHIGRMAVLAQWRGHGVGGLLLGELLKAALARGHTHVELSAQTHAIGFYQRFGFAVVSDEYSDAGIPHRTMRLALATPAPR
jgi:predicted GNAT family N-acyltransferase